MVNYTNHVERHPEAPALNNVTFEGVGGGGVIDWSDPEAVSRPGVHTPSGTKLVSANARIVAIKVPGHKVWAGIGMPQSYAKACVEVYAIGEVLGECRARCYPLGSWDARK